MHPNWLIAALRHVRTSEATLATDGGSFRGFARGGLPCSTWR